MIDPGYLIFIFITAQVQSSWRCEGKKEINKQIVSLPGGLGGEDSKDQGEDAF